MIRNEYLKNEKKYQLSVTNFVKKYAMKKTRNEWKKELGGKNDIDNNDDEINFGFNAWIPNNIDNTTDDIVA